MVDYNALLRVPGIGQSFSAGLESGQNMLAQKRQADMQEVQNTLAMREHDMRMNAMLADRRAKDQASTDAASSKAHQLEIAAASAMAYSPRPKADAERFYPEFVANLKASGQWDAVTDDQVREHAQAELRWARAQAGEETQAPVQQVKWEERKGPRGSIISYNPETGEQKQVIGPDNTQPGQAGPSSPSGYRFTRDGSLEAIPGGPADPANRNKPANTQPLRKEFRGLQSVKDYEAVLPLVKSAEKAPDNGYGDLQLIYTVGKALDPGSVVREGELALTVAAGSPLQRILGATRFNFEKGGRITPEQRQQILGMLNERVSGYKQAYERDYSQYSQYAQENGFDPASVVGTKADSAYGNKPSSKPTKTATGPNGQKIGLIDGKWVPL